MDMASRKSLGTLVPHISFQDKNIKMAEWSRLEEYVIILAEILLSKLC